MEEEKDVKPADTLTISVKDPQGEVIHFKIKSTTKLEKVLAAYAQRKGVAPGAVKFLLDGVRVLGTSTPAELEFEEGTQIDANWEQVGGC